MEVLDWVAEGSEQRLGGPEEQFYIPFFIIAHVPCQQQCRPGAIPFHLGLPIEDDVAHLLPRVQLHTGPNQLFGGDGTGVLPDVLRRVFRQRPGDDKVLERNVSLTNLAR